MIMKTVVITGERRVNLMLKRRNCYNYLLYFVTSQVRKLRTYETEEVLVRCLVRLSRTSVDGDRRVHNNGEMAISRGISKKIKVHSPVPLGAPCDAIFRSRKSACNLLRHKMVWA